MEIIDKNKKRRENREIFLYAKYKAYTLNQLIPLLFKKNSLTRQAAIFRLQIIGTDEVFTFAVNLCQSEGKQERKTGISILSQLSMSPEHLTQSFNLVEALLEKETSANVRAAAVNAIGHFCRRNPSFNSRAPELLTRTTYDKSVNTRCATAAALSEINNIKAIPLLLSLLNDSNGDVRNWAAFSVNTNEYDSKEIREAFVKMLSDDHEHARLEAIFGLAERKDSRVVKTIINELEKDIIFDELIVVAGDLGSKRFLPVLKKLLSEFNDEKTIGKIKIAIQKITSPYEF
ncbi:HEAT repeat domain-containing protein [Escherichia fergusonii]|uniref:HEAT repeat domain-containing protein n=1 Tax=Escherichia fergusonii TaxID=564 RepID=UPI0015E9F5AE|nr:HEAT repeat domain-containing protein [Escherichia fergusonii]EGO8190085.1 lyase [Escherichia fergusonii]QME65150.1 HEAT repeat domain-containing protein [Escherichia fergusonii]QME69759.1 HEAT repeat domain-containing protein [Escherichia fergusonii]QMF01400.1 HEAT repeat domain-containing protein [Escherichia fergusonii]